MAITTCDLFSRAIFTLFNLVVFTFFVAAQVFQDAEQKYFFKWFLGNTSTIDLSIKYPVSIAVAWWFRYFWYVTHSWQILWMMYSVGMLFKRNFPNALSIWFFSAHILSIGLDIAWVICSSFDMIVPSCVVSLLGVVFKLPALALVYEAFQKDFDYEKHSLADFWSFHILVFNGISANIVISLYKAFIWFAIVLTYHNDLPEQTASTIALAIAVTLTIAWFLVENLLFLWWTRFTFSIYPILIIAIISSLVENGQSTSRNFVILAVFLSLACLFLVVHVGMVTAKLTKARRSFPKNLRKSSLVSFDIEFMTTKF